MTTGGTTSAEAASQNSRHRTEQARKLLIGNGMSPSKASRLIRAEGAESVLATFGDRYNTSRSYRGQDPTGNTAVRNIMEDNAKHE